MLCISNPLITSCDCFVCSHRQGFQHVSSWKRIWGSNGKTEPSLKSYMADKVLPFWVQCNQPGCRKWRELPVGTELTLDLVRDFVCGYQAGAKKVSSTTQLTALYFCHGHSFILSCSRKSHARKFSQNGVWRGYFVAVTGSLWQLWGCYGVYVATFQ